MKYFNWKVEETEIHDYLLEAYQNQGFDCINFHESGAAVEGGIDIFSTNRNEKIAVAVKIKPKTADLKQVSTLLKNEVDTKIYVHIKDPTKPFFDGIKSYKEEGRLEVMNGKQLHDFLLKNKSVTYIKRLIYSHEIFRNFVKIMEIWLTAREHNTSKPSSQSDIALLWDWKDRVVSFHKTAKTISDYLNPKIKSIVSERDKPLQEVINDIFSSLDYMNHELEQLKSIFEKVKKNDSGFLAQMWITCRIRSNWCVLLGPLENNENVEDSFFKWLYRDSTARPYTLLYEILERIAELGFDFEMSIDWLFGDLKLN